MPTGQWPTMLDLASRTVQGKQVYIAEMLSQSIALYDDLPYREANEVGGHEGVFRTSIPAGSWRGYNQGTPYSKSTTAKFRIGVGELEGYSQVDRKIAEESGDIALFRENEDVAFIEGMGQTMAYTYFYGNSAADPRQFMGLSGFYNPAISGGAQNGANVVTGGGSGSSNTSMWLICHGERTVFATFPRGSKAGLMQEDKADTVPGFDSLGNRFEAYTCWFRHQLGVVPQDWRQVVRVANTDTTTAGLAGPNALDIFATLAEMVFLPPTLGKASGITKTDAPTDAVPSIRPVWIANRTIRHYVRSAGHARKERTPTTAGLCRNCYRHMEEFPSTGDLISFWSQKPA